MIGYEKPNLYPNYMEKSFCTDTSLTFDTMKNRVMKIIENYILNITKYTLYIKY